MREAVEVDDTAVVAGGEASEMLEAAKASLDLVAMLLDGDMMEDGNLRRRLMDHDRSGRSPLDEHRRG